MKQETFEEYLQARFFIEEPQVLDDDFPDAFNEWLGRADVDEIIDYAELWGKQLIK